jgi:glycerophosphoryl diester phosphodiesterase
VKCFDLSFCLCYFFSESTPSLPIPRSRGRDFEHAAGNRAKPKQQKTKEMSMHTQRQVWYAPPDESFKDSNYFQELDCRSTLYRMAQSIYHKMSLVTFALLLVCRSGWAQVNPMNPNGLDAALTVQAMIHPKPDLILLVAHRGDHAMPTNPTGVPENSIQAIQLAAEAGLEMVEVDIRTTSDGIPILSHDQTWGRETDYCAPSGTTFNPLIPIKQTASPGQIASNEACNPNVNSLSLLTLRTFGVQLRDSVNYTVSSEQPSTLQEVLDYFKANQIGMVLALDIKTAADAAACWQVVQANTDYLGRPSALTTVFRIQAAAYQTPQSFKNAFGANYSAVNYWPTYGTGIWNAPPAGFGSEIGGIANLQQFQQDSTISLVAAEVQIKQPGGILSSLINDARTNIRTNSPASITEFNPLSEWTDPNNTSAINFYGTAGTYKSSTDPVANNTPLGGHCCITLDYYFYQGTNGQPSDTADDRTDINFILSNNPNIITTDDAVNLSQQLENNGKRKIGYLISPAIPTCNAYSPYPDCNDPNNPGQTTYTYCTPGDEDLVCSFTGDRNVAYGANGIYETKTFTNAVTCEYQSFGTDDPVPGVHKSCFISPPVSYHDAVYCGDEGQYCYFSGTWYPLIAANQKYSIYTFPKVDGYQCNGYSFGFFGDPIPGFQKACFYYTDGLVNSSFPFSGYTICANEGGICQFKGLGRVAYGWNGKFEFKVLDGGLNCNNTAWGDDPSPGYTKRCFYQVITPYSDATGTQVGGGGNCSNGYPECDANGQSTYTYCAAGDQGQTCSFTGVRNVAYGANGLFNVQTFTNSVACNVQVLGPDPDYGVQKACYYGPAISSFSTNSQLQSIYCGDDFGTCSPTGPATGYYGTPPFNDIAAAFGGAFTCSPTQFGEDPNAGVRKTCSYQLPGSQTGGPAGYVLCATGDVGQTCKFAGLGRVAYGANGQFIFGVFNGGTPCNVSVFGSDPDFGVSKNCYYEYELPAAFSGGNTTSAGQANFGPNVVVIDPSMSPATINATMNELNQEAQFSGNRYAVLFKPGTYGSASSPVISQVGYYEQIAGLGISPDSVRITGGFYADQLIYPPGTNQGVMTENFWRSQENMNIVPSGGPTNGILDWGVSQGASLRRMDISGGVWYTNSNSIGTTNPCAESSGGFTADSQFEQLVNACSQQQWYTRDSILIGGFTGYVWNFVFSGVLGNPPAQSYPGGPGGDDNVTEVGPTPVRREKPFLYIDSNGNYNVFVSTLQTKSSGTDWNASSTYPGKSLPISSFFIATPSNTLADINNALLQGQNLILTPGIYRYNGPISVLYPNTIVLGMGYATLVPQTGTSAIVVADVDGVQIAGVIIDAGPVNSNILMEVGEPGVPNLSHAANPTSLNDVFFRIGGAEVGSATTSLQVDSGNVILDNIWAWRADHGNPGTVGWTVNTAAHGVVVNGSNVTALGLAVEHYQQEQVLWNGGNGETIFYQSELPYDPPNQAAWSDPNNLNTTSPANVTTNGYPSYVVSSSVCSHQAYGFGIYSFFNQGVNILEDNAMIVPNTTGVNITDVGTIFLNGSGQISNVIDGIGGSASSANPATLVPVTSFVGNGGNCPVTSAQ